MLSIFSAWIWPIWAKRPILIYSIFIIPITLVIGQVSIPWFTRELLNALYEKSNIQTQSLYLAGTWALSKLIIRLQIFINAIPIANFIQDIRAQVIKAILQLNYQARMSKSASNWTQITMDIAKSVEFIYGMLLWNVLPTLGLFTLILIEVYGIHPLFFWIYFSYILFQLNIMWYLKKTISTKSQAHNNAKNRLIENYTPLFKPVFKLENQQQIHRMMNHFGCYAQQEIRTRNTLIRSINMARLWMDCIAIAVFLGIILLMITLHHSILIGDLSFIIMTSISTIDKAWSLGQNWCDLQSAISLLNNHKWLSKVKNTPKLIKHLSLESTDIHIKNLSFTYDEKTYIFRDLNLSLPNTSIVGIVGKPGSGKSTLLSLLFGTLIPKKGGFLLSNQAIAQNSLCQNSDFMHFINQEPDLYLNLDIESNLKLVNSHVTTQAIDAALTLAQIHHLNRETLAKNLSGGQKQQLCIARAFLDEKPIWLLDEALSAVDDQTHHIIMRNIITHSKTRKIVIISHQQRDHVLYKAHVNLDTLNTQCYLVSSET